MILNKIDSINNDLVEFYWRKYLLWQEEYNKLCTACQFINIKRFVEYLNDNSIYKISILDRLSNDFQGMIFFTKDCDKTDFYNPLYFETHPVKDVVFIPRGCMFLNPNIWINGNSDYSLFDEIKKILSVNKIIIDHGDMLGPYSLLPEGVKIDTMVAVGWDLANCKIQITDYQKLNIDFLYNYQNNKDVDYKESWNLFIKGFDNIQDSICPPLFDKDYHDELFNDPEIAKTYIRVDGKIVGGMIVLPIEKIPFIEQDKIIQKIGIAKKIYFILSMTVLKEYRKIKYFTYLGMRSMKIFSTDTFIGMDHSLNLNSGFESSIKRYFNLSRDKLIVLGKQFYKIVK